MGTEPAGSVFGKNAYLETRGTTEVAMWLHVVLNDPRVASPCQSSGRGPNANCGYCSPLCNAGVWRPYSGDIHFIESQGVNGHSRPVPGAPSSGTTRESQAKFRDGTMWAF